MSNGTKIERALVVLSPDLVKPEAPLESALLRRATDFAKRSGCELELFHVCYDVSLDYQLFPSEAALQQKREILTDRDATLLGEIAARLRDEQIEVTHEVRWDHPRTDAILRKIAQSKPDIVLKQAREHSFLFGIRSNTDWDLARRSPIDLWFVAEDTAGIERIVTAIGNPIVAAGEDEAGVDRQILETANNLAGIYDATIYPVNAYQVPAVGRFIAGVDGVVAPTGAMTGVQETREEMIERHTRAIRDLARDFDRAKDHIHVHEGHPTKVITDVAESVDAGMIVMGASTIGRLERLVTPVTVEPVMAEASCDILVVRERDGASMPDSVTEPFYGRPRYDVEHAITDPEGTFESPQDVVQLDEISIDLRRRILQAWEYDIRASMAEENEGGPARGIDLNALEEIEAARQLLAGRAGGAGKEQPRLNSTS